MKHIFSVLGVLTGLVTLVTISLWFTGYYVAAAAIGAFAVAMWLLLVIMLSVALGSWWTLKVEDRAAARIQAAINQNDNFDAKKTASMAQLVREGIRLGVNHAPRLGGPSPLPLPGQVSDWLSLPSETPLDVDFLEDEN